MHGGLFMALPHAGHRPFSDAPCEAGASVPTGWSPHPCQALIPYMLLWRSLERKPLVVGEAPAGFSPASSPGLRFCPPVLCVASPVCLLRSRLGSPSLLGSPCCVHELPGRLRC